jgi:hypothetical protein
MLRLAEIEFGRRVASILRNLFAESGCALKGICSEISVSISTIYVVKLG